MFLKPFSVYIFVPAVKHAAFAVFCSAFTVCAVFLAVDVLTAVCVDFLATTVCLGLAVTFFAAVAVFLALVAAFVYLLALYTLLTVLTAFTTLNGFTAPATAHAATFAMAHSYAAPLLRCPFCLANRYLSWGKKACPLGSV